MSSHTNCQVYILQVGSFTDVQASHTHIVVQYNPQEFRFSKAQRHKFILLQDVIWSAILDPPSWISLSSLKIQEITEITAKSRQNAYEMYKLVNFCTLRLETMSKQLIFGQMYMKFAPSKNHEHTIDIKISARGEWAATVSFQPYGVSNNNPFQCKIIVS